MNQNPEQIARDQIDAQLRAAGWRIEDVSNMDIHDPTGVAVREMETNAGPADYVLYVDSEPIGIIEAKREELGYRLSDVEQQVNRYRLAGLKHVDGAVLNFAYISNGVVLNYIDYRDPKPRSREVFGFHRPETLLAFQHQSASLRARLQNMPPLDEAGLRPAQIKAINNLEKSFAENRPRALIQMATGAGKTFTACTFVYRLLKHARAKRVLFLVDTRNLGEQAEEAFRAFTPNDDNRTFTELYNVQRLSSSYIAPDTEVCISTIQRLYSMLQGEEMNDGADEDNPYETGSWKKRPPEPVVYNPENPISQFDFVIIDECHRSIYNLWRQVLEYYDAFLIGLTATPEPRTRAFFQKVVSEYTLEESIIDGVNVPYDVHIIETEITKNGSVALRDSHQRLEHREKMSRRQLWETAEDDLEYEGRQLDRDVVTPDQIRTVIKEFKRVLPSYFPERYYDDGSFEVPKTLIFAKSDSHANDIIDIVREEFGEGNDFCKKVTYKTVEKPRDVISQFRNSTLPRIAVTVDMIATGTDVKPLEVLLFLRDVKSANYFEQMKGRGTRTIDLDTLRRVSGTARFPKTNFMLFDAVGATNKKKSISRSLERKPGEPLVSLLKAVKQGHRDEDLFTTLAGRLIRLDRLLQPAEQDKFAELAGGRSLKETVRGLLHAYDPDVVEAARTQVQRELLGQSPNDIEAAQARAETDLQKNAIRVFNGKLCDYIENVRKVHSQVIDRLSLDRVLRSEAASFSLERSREVVTQFEDWLREHTDEFLALRIYFSEPQRRREVTYQMIQDLVERLQTDKPALAPHYVWEAYAKLEDVSGDKPESALVALVSLVRRVAGIDDTLSAFPGRVDRNFQTWIFNHNNTAADKFSDEQLNWLRMIRDYVKQSFHLERDDFELSPFDAHGGIGGFYRAFGTKYEEVIEEMNEILVA